MPVVRSIVEITKELLELKQDLKVLMDGLTVNSLNFLSTISHELYYRTAEYVTKPVAFVYKGCIEKLLTVHKKGGLNITTTRCDNEFCKVMDPF